MSEQETDLGNIQPNPVFLSRYTLQIRTQRQGEKSHEPKAYVPQEVTELLIHQVPCPSVLVLSHPETHPETGSLYKEQMTALPAFPKDIHRDRGRQARPGRNAGRQDGHPRGWHFMLSSSVLYLISRGTSWVA